MGHLGLPSPACVPVADTVVAVFVDYNKSYLPPTLNHLSLFPTSSPHQEPETNKVNQLLFQRELKIGIKR